MHNFRTLLRTSLALTIGLSFTAEAFENTQVLPKGVRNLNLRSVNTEFDEKSGPNGTPVPLAEPLMEDLTFALIAKGEEKLRGDQIRAFLTTEGFEESDSVGEFTADVNGRISVFAPISSYGLTDRHTVALAVPVYSASTSASVGFQPNENASAFLAALSRPENNQTIAAREAGDKINNAVARLNDKLVDNNYKAIQDWNAQGLGDITVASKYRALSTNVLGVATTNGIVAPTGREDDPEILTDIPFGDGQWDIFSQLAFDQTIVKGLVVNQFGKYTVQLPGSKTVRALENDESIEVPYTSTRFKLGDKIDAGASLQWSPAFGLVSGVGYTYFQKFGDLYKDTRAETKGLLEKNTDQLAHNSEVQFGYSTIPHYQAGIFAVPMEVKLTFIRQMSSRNMPITDLAQFDLNLFF
jgi:hypothetical protein